MIAALAAGLIARPWARRALRWAAVALAILLFLLFLKRAGRMLVRQEQVAENLRALERGESPTGRVDPDRGY